MAWSDAARRAALEMRRRHAAFKKQFPAADYRKQRGWDIAGIYSRGQRNVIAADLKAFRARIRSGKTRGPSWMGGYFNATAKSAAVSTATRNFLRQSQRKR